ncbi:putative toxin-antitoxin system toxin component, PIN family [Mucilaginibacter sp. L3T2-6]|uniref:putative toxin-antitoxin system toxin component, PIN family n=1 Tax=Mucilaginibacter sp. L3T2-6 TaxID=3062491 RepID=UPI002676F284|nr:putative toxin-antitoxin system toxin component, PIN family [Mucilaginibacter sp. L3T2-6]MDO3641725.1 putative toxin-antitoxin system toxin component, PIN family [Mucilaginibacter sp. L3T2-6]MDV6214219.1 putative toxin-antitoxin system toxin component, PIN family [Mucilaginibacter sp. L3T2-6]
MIVVVDTNCLLASIPPQSRHYWLYQAFERGLFEWLISNEIMSEYEEKITSRYSDVTANLVLSILSAAHNVIFAEPYFKWNIIGQDADDNKFTDLAIAGNADYIVTNDKHFDIAKTLDFPKLNIVTLDEFKKIVLT